MPCQPVDIHERPTVCVAFKVRFLDVHPREPVAQLRAHKLPATLNHRRVQKTVAENLLVINKAKIDVEIDLFPISGLRGRTLIHSHPTSIHEVIIEYPLLNNPTASRKVRELFVRQHILSISR
jgi:hypothetical protein